MNDFQLNDVVVRPRLNEIQIDGRIERLPAKFIDVLMVLAERQGEVFSKAQLLKRVWNDPAIGEDSLANAVWMLRRTLGDDAKRPSYIETVPRRGYRLIARFAAVSQQPNEAAGSSGSDPVQAFCVDLTAAVTVSPAACDPESPDVGGIVAPQAHTPHRNQRARLWVMATLVLLAVMVFAWRWETAREAVAATPFAFRTSGNVTAITVPNAGEALVADSGGMLYAIDTRNGTERWRFAAGAQLQIPTTGARAQWFLGGDDGYLYALDARNGREIWRYATGKSVQTVPLTRDDRVVYGDIGGRVQAVRGSDAQPLWSLQLDSRVVGSILGPLDLAVVHTLDGTIAAIDRSDGVIRWQQSFPAPISDPIQASNSRIVFARDEGFVTALDARSGATLWQAELPAAEVKPLIVADQVFALGRYGDLIALRLGDGSVLWRTRADIGDTHALLWWSDCIVVVLDGGIIGLLDPEDGSLRRSLRLPETLDDLAVDAERLILTMQSGQVIAIDHAQLAQRQGSHLSLQADGQLQVLEHKAQKRARFAIEAMQAGVRLPTLQWRVALMGHVQDISVGADGTAYLSDEHSAMAMSPNGSARWRLPLKRAMGSQVALTEPRVFFGRRDGNVYALERDTGKLLWRFVTAAQVISAPTVAAGRVYVGSDDRHLYALDAETGATLWSFETQRPVRGAAVVDDRHIVFGSADRHVYALDINSGLELWRFAADDWIVATPLLIGKRVFVGAGNGDFFALDVDTGKPIWRFHSGAKVWFRPAADAQSVFFGSGDGHLYALDQATGTERWRYRTGAAAEGAVVLVDGVLYAGSHDFHLYALDSSNGHPLWRLRTGGSVFNPGVGNGMLWVASADQHLYALNLQTNPMPK